MKIFPNTKEIRKIRVFIVSPFPLILFALRIILENEQDIEVVAESDIGKEAVEIAARLHPDIAVIDLDMFPLDGIQTCKQIKQIYPDTQIIVVVENKKEKLKQIQQAGAIGYLYRVSAPYAFVRMIRKIVLSEKLSKPIGEEALNLTSEESLKQHCLPKVVYPSLNADPLALSRARKLTPKEITMLRLLAMGSSNKTISLKMHLSLANVKATLTSIYTKLGVSSRTEAVISTFKLGIIEIYD